MYKKIIGGIAVVAIAVAMALSVNLNAKNNNLSSISLVNVEALTGGEDSEGKGFVYCSGSDIICTGTGRYTCCV
ncbi:MAG: NVEALA domain-containing protein [Firmicutes bacterium]|nr:NVEALA domain-containing protein [Bacillota bacterium]